jgi:hypothetical protein
MCAVRALGRLSPRAAFTLLAGASSLACQFAPGGDAPENDGTEIDAAIDSPDAPVAPEPDAARPTVCTPNETRCDGRALSACNAAGDGYLEPVECAFTCEADDHCTLASNLPRAEQAACGPGEPVLAPTSGTITVRDSALGGIRMECSDGCGDGDEIRGTAVAQDLGVGMIYFCVSRLDIPSGVTVRVDSGVDRSIAILVDGVATVSGSIDVGAEAASSQTGPAGPGATAGGAQSDEEGAPGGGTCGGGGGRKNGPNMMSAGGGGAGGSFGSRGAAGGNGRFPMGADGQPIQGGQPAAQLCGDADLEPVIGGAGGGAGGDGSCGDCGWPGGGGGGALQIAARGGIEISGTIDASGGDGFGLTSNDNGRGGGGGGGSGGAILLEAPTLTIAPGAVLRVDGGRGGIAFAGEGGAGATGGQAAQSGRNAAGSPQGGTGGGGGGGRIRLNAVEPSCRGGSASPTSACTTGSLKREGAFDGH